VTRPFYVHAKGWGEPHPMARRGLIPPAVAMVYAPRAAAEVDTILQVIAVSFRLACAEGPAACSAGSRSRHSLLHDFEREPGDLVGDVIGRATGSLSAP
jgi:hypothetical protein